MKINFEKFTDTIQFDKLDYIHNVFVCYPLGVCKKILFHFKKCCKCYSLLMGHT